MAPIYHSFHKYPALYKKLLRDLNLPTTEWLLGQTRESLMKHADKMTELDMDVLNGEFNMDAVEEMLYFADTPPGVTPVTSPGKPEHAEFRSWALIIFLINHMAYPGMLDIDWISGRFKFCLMMEGARIGLPSPFFATTIDDLSEDYAHCDPFQDEFSDTSSELDYSSSDEYSL